MKKNSQRFRITAMLLFACMLALTACSSGQNNNLKKEAAEQLAAGEDNSELAMWPRTITDARGQELTISAKPKKVAVVTWMITENLMALDTPPIAADSVGAMAEWASMKDYFQKYSVDNLGDSQTSINLEQLLDLKPDLILATNANADIYDKLEQIAPLFVFDSGALFSDWQGSIRSVAKVVGEEEKAEKFIEQTMEQVALARQKASEIEKKVGFVRVWNGALSSFSVDQLAMYYDKEKGIGLTIPDGWPKETGALSIESITTIDPDYLFISGAEDQAYLEKLEQTAVWKSLRSVKANQVFAIDLSGLTGGPLAVQYGVRTVIDALN
ncbi:ABC transporter substrate-binding protein [Paenibacillus gorillae]|uniref:ABC transporter substrate-binding protein n=1 Tax=Paenibacillus gorillae TaxID=1243662 RepID=UPI0005A63C04|nr:ABC transporter substrate-binding protein [Paenibacillus gorillae]